MPATLTLTIPYYNILLRQSRAQVVPAANILAVLWVPHAASVSGIFSNGTVSWNSFDRSIFLAVGLVCRHVLGWAHSGCGWPP